MKDCGHHYLRNYAFGSKWGHYACSLLHGSISPEILK
uniref:Uncharacterized protein n=1 Tax=Arundo donax TaxID=35708 RepID=A0A0A9FFR4_ARUDO